MAKKRFVVEVGTGVDLHGENVTETACKAVRDAISRSCLSGLVEILGLGSMESVEIDILVACPNPERVDLEKVKEVVPIGRKTVRAVLGGLQAQGLCVARFGPGCDQIVMANAALTVYVDVAP